MLSLSCQKLGRRNPGFWGQVGRGQASRRWQLKERDFKPIGSTQEAVPAKDASLLSVVPAGVSVFLRAAGRMGLPGRAVQMDTEHAAHPPPAHSILGPGMLWRQRWSKPWAALPREAWAQAGQPGFSRSSPKGMGPLWGRMQNPAPRGLASTWLRGWPVDFGQVTSSL